ncbi:ComEC/Rec2 family competence protein [Candidatus Tisiphia endosymbiont of Temnostethus pusillus]|uniref:ComEC/Rec2 family competence protein n=1 Tax=Candidatus Tisiphia endosymbiont of Temnostethus pusillus TaxID=3139335 RepID=UPI0035C905CB
MTLRDYKLIFRLAKSILEQEYHNLSLWYFVSFICGIGTYFTLSSEPSFISILAIFTISLSLIILRNNIFGRFIAGIIIAFSCGMLVGKYRISNLHVVGIKKPIISRISGIVESMKPTTHGMQVILYQVKIQKLKQVLQKVRISMPAKYAQEININDNISLVAQLYKPQSSILPGGYDFGFYAYLADINATGYALSPPQIIAHSNLYTNSFIYKIKKNIYNRLLQILGSIKGNFAAAILLGETKAIDRKLMKEMRQSGISHILCVSGLHLSLVAMLFFISARFLLNLSNYIAYNYNIKSIAAICSLIGSYGYLQLSGTQIAATRAFIMTAIFIYAVMIGRKPYPLRSLAIAACIILSVNPEYIFHPSFQLSFVAVLSLTAGYEFYIRNQWILGKSKGIFSSIKFYIASNIYSSFLASIVTAPVVINQFYTFPTYSIPMNLIAVPIMSFFLMPLSIISLFLMMFGIDQYCLKLVGFFINIIIAAVKFTNSLPLSVWYFGYITKISLITFLFGFFWTCLWRTKWHFLGLIIMIISVILMLNSPKPNFIFDMNLNAVGIKNNNGELDIYVNEMPEFKRIYWANWFGQKDAKIFPIEKNIFTSDGYTILVNYKPIAPNKICENVDIYINISSRNQCKGNKITITRELLREFEVIMIFCNQHECTIKTNNKKRWQGNCKSF